MGVRKNMKKLMGTDRGTRTMNETPKDSENESQQTVGADSLSPLQSNADVGHSERSLQNNQAMSAANSMVRLRPAPGYRSSLAVLQAMQANTRISYASSIHQNQYGHAGPHLSPKTPTNEPDRVSMYEGSLRRSRPQSIYGDFHPHSSPQRTRPVSYIGYATTKNHFSDGLNPIDEDEKLLEESKKEIQQIKIQDIESTRNALRLAYQAFQIGRNTLGTLGEQSDRLHNAERKLDQTSIENATATRKLKELKTTTRLISLFNPFASAKSECKESADAIAARHQHYQDRDAVRLDAWHAWKLKEARFFVSVPLGPGATRRDREARAKYQLEPDSDDDALEDEIEDNLEETLHVVRGARIIAAAQGEEIEWQNRGLGRMDRKMDEVGDGLVANTLRLDRIR